jgi:hypothetical protein
MQIQKSMTSWNFLCSDLESAQYKDLKIEFFVNATVNVNSVIGLLHRLNVCNVVAVSELYTVSIFRLKGVIY